MSALLSALCGPCCACLRRQGFHRLVELVESSERGEFDMDETMELHLPSAAEDKMCGWLDLKIGVALVWMHTFCLLHNGNLELYYTDVDKSDRTLEDFMGIIDLCGALLFAARSSTYIEIRNEDASFYFKMNSVTQFESWRMAIKREIELCNWSTFIEHSGESAAMPPDLVSWSDRLQESRETAVRELSEGAVMTKHFTALGFRRSHRRIIKVRHAEALQSESSHVVIPRSHMVQVACRQLADAEEESVVLNGSGAVAATALPSLDSDKVMWTVPANEANMEEPESKGVSEVSFSSIKAILSGATESPVLRSLKYPEAKVRTCFSIVSNTDKMYDFEASSQEERDKWVRGLFAILKYDTLIARAQRHVRITTSTSHRHSKLQLRKALGSISS